MIIAKTIIYLVLIICAGALLIYNLFYHREAMKGERLLALQMSPTLKKLCTIDRYLSWILIAAIFFFMLIHFLTSL